MKPISRDRHGYFDGQEVRGIQYECSSGGKGWHVAVSPNGSNEHDYWVSSKREFHPISLNLSPGFSYESVIGISTTLIEPKPQEKKAILAAIAEWESS